MNKNINLLLDQAIEENLFSEEVISNREYNEILAQVTSLVNNKKIRERYHSKKRFRDNPNDIVIGYGAKTGETYYQHITKGINYIISLYPYLLEKEEKNSLLFKICTISYMIHDLNKLYWGLKYKNKIWSSKTVSEELTKVDELSGGKLSEVLDWENFIPEITSIIRLHDRDAKKQGREIKSQKLSERECRLCGRILFIVDRLDLLHNLRPFYSFIAENKEREKYKETINQNKIIEEISFKLGQIIESPIKLSKIRVSSQSTSFSNILLNLCVEELEKKYDLHALSIFIDGILVWGESEIKNFDQFIESIALRFVKRFDALIMNSDKVYKTSMRANEITEYAFQKPNVEEKVEIALQRLIEDYKPLDKNSREKKLEKMKKRDYYTEEMRENKYLRKWFDDDVVDLIENEVIWKNARFLELIYYNLYKIIDKYTSEDREDLMKRFLKHLNVFNEVSEFYDKFKSIYFAYTFYFFPIIGDLIISKEISNKELIDLCLEFFKEELRSLDITEEAFNLEDLKEIIKRKIHLVKKDKKSTKIIKEKKEKDKFLYCTTCGKRMKKLSSKKKNEEKYRWKRDYLRKSVKVQKFSNRRMAGDDDEPIRFICEGCRLEFWIEKLLSSNENQNNYFITFYLPTGYPYIVIKSIKKTIRSIKSLSEEENPKVFKIDYNEYKKKREIKLNGKEYGSGLELPKIDDTIAGIIMTPYIIKDKVDYFDAILMALTISISSNLKVTISKLPTSQEDLLNGDTIKLLELPIEFKYLFCNRQSFSKVQERIILEMLNSIKEISREVFNKKEKKMRLEIIRSFVRGDIISYLYSKLERKEDNKKSRKIILFSKKIRNLKNKLQKSLKNNEV